MTDVGLDAHWRDTGLTFNEFMHRVLSSGKTISPLMSVPGVSLAIFRVDWLHAVDQGVAADFLGNALKVVVSVMPGASRSVRVQALWVEMQMYYDRYEITDRLPTLVWEAIQGKKKSPKLRCSAACCRALVRFGWEICRDRLDARDPVHEAVRTAAYHLWMCYQSLSTECLFPDELLSEHGRLFALQLVALGTVSDDRDWKVKPKLHLFMHLISEGSRPTRCWTYRDEDYGGTIARLSRMRGRWLHLSAFSSHVLDLWRVKNPVPRIV